MPAEVENMAYVRAVPWHGIGTKVDELMTARDALVVGGLDWTVSKSPIMVRGREVPNRVATVRDSDDSTLGLVGANYQIIQNAEAFDWADSLVDSGQAKYETVGSLFGGRRVFLSMELPEGIHVPGDDGEVKPYILVTNGHDGTTPLAGRITMVRVVCANTWTLAVKGATRSFKIRHSGSMEGKLAAAREALGITFEYSAEFAKAASALAAKAVTEKQADSVFERVFPISKRALGTIDKDPSAIDDTPFGEVRTLYHQSENIDPIRGTGWGVLQAVGEYLDHTIEYKGRRWEPMDVRMDSICYDGPVADKKQLAYSILTNRDFARSR